MSSITVLDVHLFRYDTFTHWLIEISILNLNVTGHVVKWWWQWLFLIKTQKCVISGLLLFT